ncbi:MAG: NAD-dependent epimerase/dehydratase family protein [Haliea sp.]
MGSGRKRTGRRVLMVGTDCAVGKKYTALALARDMRRRGLNVDFRASGQTGIMIAGGGLPMDAVVSDFLSGAAELLSPDNSADHWDVIEGQGGIFHPGFGAVSLGLLLGSQPDAFVVCHEAGRNHLIGWEGFALPTIEQVIERTVELGSLTNPAISCVGVSINTSRLPPGDRSGYLEELSERLGLPCVDPLQGGTDPLVGRLLQTPQTVVTDGEVALI